MSELDAETQALLDLGRGGDDPSDDAVDHNRRKLALKLGATALGTSLIAGSASKAAAASAAGAWTTAKVVVACGVVLAGGAALGTYALGARPDSPVSSAVVSPSVRGPTAAPVQTHAAPASPTPPAESVVQPAPEAPARPSPSVKAEGARSIQSELELIRGAQKHLHRGDARAALTLLAEHARRFPSGALTEEREASRVFALCQLGDVSGARAQAERFVRRSPSSPFAERVRSSCRSGAR